MIETYFARPSTINWLRGGPLGSDLDDLANALQQQGYASDSIRHYLRGCDQFARWVSRQGYAVSDVNPTLIKHYISGLQRPPSGNLPKAAVGLSHLLTLWRQQKRLSEHSDDASHTEAGQWLLRYEQYLDQVCGTAAGTRRHYLRMARRFLAACFGMGHLAWSSLQAQQIADFVQQEAANKHGSGRNLPSTAVRSVLRFLVFSGELSPGLEAAALAPRQWTHDSIPPCLTAQEVEQVLALYSGDSPTDLRNCAIFMLLARLGLRAHEVVSLCLDDINWHEAHLIIRAGKAHHERVLPLSQDVGSTLAEYLCWGRPATTSRRVFLPVHAPFRPFSNSTAITQIATRALSRVGVTRFSRLGAHVFRHTAASRMVNRGASFKEVADVLGHQSLQTTAIYAKLDLVALSEVALPWIGEPQ
ncbi:MAG TPA: site-specific integrase [Candidatus Saccharimonadia bacterium]|nr:site-specific integrase [Candidatus Saccharimonadia bacterium]